MPDDLSWLTEEVNENILRENNVPRVEIWLNGQRYVRELIEPTLDSEDCDIKTRRRLWCSVFGHKDLSPGDVSWIAVCHCGALAAYVNDIDAPAGRFVHLGRCARCNAAHLPRARLVR